MNAANGQAGRETPNLIARLVEALEEIDREAVNTRRRLSAGEAVNGSGAMQRIHYAAADALEEARGHRS